MQKKWFRYGCAAMLLALGSLGLFWAPFALQLGTFWGIDFGHASMQTIVTNFDGINFLVVAKSLYDPHLIEVQYASILSGRENLYFSAHYPGFPLLIRAFDLFVSGPNALLLSIVASNVLLAGALYALFYLITKKAQGSLWLTTLALFFPARMLAMRGVGSNESLFMFFVLVSLMLSTHKKHWLSGLMGGLAVLTRSPGILLLFSYFFSSWTNMRQGLRSAWRQLIPYLIIPLTLLSLWTFYGIRFGDFLSYFKVGGNINLYFPPFLVFGSHFDWVSGMWLEDIIYTYLLYSAGVALFYHHWVRARTELRPIFYFAVIYLSTIFFVVHRDIARYALPIAPIALAGFAPYLQHKYVKYGFSVLVIAIFLYSWNFILQNTQPVMDWAPFL